MTNFKTVVSTIALMTALGSTTASAVETETKQELTAVGAIAAGAIAGGPIGAVIGMFSSVWLVDQVEKADGYEDAQLALEANQGTLSDNAARIAALETELMLARQEQERYANMALDQLQLEMLFRTGESALTSTGKARLAMLADFLESNPDLSVKIDGFADPRGDAKSNLALSQSRAEKVAEQLVSAGVDPTRLVVNAHGEAGSTAAQGDIDAYAFERKVQIEVFSQQTVAQTSP